MWQLAKDFAGQMAGIQLCTVAKRWGGRGGRERANDHGGKGGDVVSRRAHRPFFFFVKAGTEK